MSMIILRSLFLSILVLFLIYGGYALGESATDNSQVQAQKVLVFQFSNATEWKEGEIQTDTSDRPAPLAMKKSLASPLKIQNLSYNPKGDVNLSLEKRYNILSDDYRASPEGMESDTPIICYFCIPVPEETRPY